MGGWQDGESPTSGRTEVEIANSLHLTDFVHTEAKRALQARELRITPDLICALHRTAMHGYLADAGSYRTVDCDRPILGSKHQPPAAARVAELVVSMCAHINATPPRFPADDDYDGLVNALADGLDVGAYALWRLNWIHPFEDGNGRTSRALCYLVFTVHANMQMPGVRSLPERISDEPRKFNRCLEAADDAYRSKQRIRVQQLREFIKKHILAQYREAQGRASQPPR